MSHFHPNILSPDPERRQRILPVLDAALDAVEVGLTSMMLGGGRTKKSDPIDYGVGIVLHAKTGDHVAAGAPLLTIHAHSADTLAAARERLLAAFTWSEQPVAIPPHIRKIIG